jgi:NADPH:quinone reductase-like Zn-dependent oxidoreductase
MKKYVFGAVAASGLITLALGLASPALAMPVVDGPADEAVKNLEDQGYKVIVNKVGTASLSQCTATAVRPGQAISHRVSAPADGSNNNSREVLRYTTVYVDVTC